MLQGRESEGEREKQRASLKGRFFSSAPTAAAQQTLEVWNWFRRPALRFAPLLAALSYLLLRWDCPNSREGSPFGPKTEDKREQRDGGDKTHLLKGERSKRVLRKEVCVARSSKAKKKKSTSTSRPEKEKRRAPDLFLFLSLSLLCLSSLSLFSVSVLFPGAREATTSLGEQGRAWSEKEAV